MDADDYLVLRMCLSFKAIETVGILEAPTNWKPKYLTLATRRKCQTSSILVKYRLKRLQVPQLSLKLAEYSIAITAD